MATGGITRKWALAPAWSAAVEVTAAAYQVAPEVLTAKSRGRGPRPPKEAWAAKKTAVHLTVILTDCDYAELGRLVGLHRDTVASHCAAMREACAIGDESGVLSHALETVAHARLEVSGAPSASRRALGNVSRIPPTTIARINALERFTSTMFERARAELSVERNTSDTSDTSREREGFRGTGEAA